MSSAAAALDLSIGNHMPSFVECVSTMQLGHERGLNCR
jgi:hypothetical protein